MAWVSYASPQGNRSNGRIAAPRLSACGRVRDFNCRLRGVYPAPHLGGFRCGATPHNHLLFKGSQSQKQQLFCIGCIFFRLSDCRPTAGRPGAGVGRTGLTGESYTGARARAWEAVCVSRFHGSRASPVQKKNFFLLKSNGMVRTHVVSPLTARMVCLLPHEERMPLAMRR